MKQQSKLVIAVVSGLVIASSALAQSIVNFSTLSMNQAGTDPIYGGTWSDPDTTTLTSLPSGLEVSSYGYGYLHYDIPAGDQLALNTADTLVKLTFTVNSPTPDGWVWVGTGVILDDSVAGPGVGGSEDIWYNGYGGDQGGAVGNWTTLNGNVVTEVYNLTSHTLTAAAAGGSIIGFNVLLDPAVVTGGFYDLTFNSIELMPAPEPTSLALVGLGALGLLAIRRRK